MHTEDPLAFAHIDIAHIDIAHIDIAPNGISSAVQIHNEWLNQINNGWDIFIRPFFGLNMPGSPLPVFLVVSDEGPGLASNYHAGSYIGLRREKVGFYIRGKMDLFLGLHFSAGVVF